MWATDEAAAYYQEHKDDSDEWGEPESPPADWTPAAQTVYVTTNIGDVDLWSAADPKPIDWKREVHQAGLG